MMTKKNKVILIVAAGVLVVIIAATVWIKFLSPEKRLYAKIKDNPDMVTLFNEAVAVEDKIKKDPDKSALYLELGFKWKSIAERSKVSGFFDKALEAYEAGIKKFGQQNILFYLNGGKLAEYVGDNAKAEKYYKKAIEISSADESGYLDLADLYSYKMKKDKVEILKVYEQGLKNQANAVSLVTNRASYLRRIGDFKAALEDYKLLSQGYPDNAAYKEVIQELQTQIQP